LTSVTPWQHGTVACFRARRVPRPGRRPRPGGDKTSPCRSPLLALVSHHPVAATRQCIAVFFTPSPPCPPREMSTPSGPRSSPLFREAIRSSAPLSAPSLPHSFPHSLPLIFLPPTDTNHGRRHRRASPATETSPSKSLATRTSAVPHSPSLRKESQREAQDRRRHPHPLPLRPLPCREARGLYISSSYAIFISLRSPRHELSHGHLLFS